MTFESFTVIFLCFVIGLTWCIIFRIYLRNTQVIQYEHLLNVTHGHNCLADTVNLSVPAVIEIPTQTHVGNDIEESYVQTESPPDYITIPSIVTIRTECLPTTYTEAAYSQLEYIPTSGIVAHRDDTLPPRYTEAITMK